MHGRMNSLRTPKHSASLPDFACQKNILSKLTDTSKLTDVPLLGIGFRRVIQAAGGGMSTASWASDVYDYPPIDGMQTQAQPQYGQPQQQQQFLGGMTSGPYAFSNGAQQQMFVPQQPTADIRGVGVTFDEVRLSLPCVAAIC